MTRHKKKNLNDKSSQPHFGAPQNDDVAIKMYSYTLMRHLVRRLNLKCTSDGFSWFVGFVDSLQSYLCLHFFQGAFGMDHLGISCATVYT